MAEEVVVDAAGLRGVPEGMSMSQAAAWSTTYGTSYHALKQRGALQPGETLLVLGAGGGVGLAAVELGKAMGARVLAAASSEAKREAARAAGADEVIDYSDGELKEKVKALTDGRATSSTIRSAATSSTSACAASTGKAACSWSDSSEATFRAYRSISSC